MNPSACDDENTTHGKSPDVCMIDNDWGKFDPKHGHYGSPACPFTSTEWAVFVPNPRPSNGSRGVQAAVSEVFAWFMLNRGSLDVIIHPNSGCEVYDHRDWPLWMGTQHPLDLSCLHYDCPGCNAGDCVSRGDAAVLSGTYEKCGLGLRLPRPSNHMGGGSLRLQLENRTAFCTPVCVDWAATQLPAWQIDCPANCDLLNSTLDTSRLPLCEAHTNTPRDMLVWASACPSPSTAPLHALLN